MKKILAYLGCFAFAFAMCLCVLLSIVSEPYTTERALSAFGATVSFIAALLFAGYGNSLPWKKESK